MKSLFEILFGQTSGVVELRGFDKVTEAPITGLFSRDPKEIASWILENQDRANLFFGVCTRKSSATSGRKNDCHEIGTYWADLDFKDFPGGEEEARQTLDRFPLKPTVLVKSGHGLHTYWLFKEPENLDGSVAVHETTLKGIAKAIRGDHVSDISRILRIPGTTNFPTTKKRATGCTEPTCCEIESITDLRYNPSDFGEWREPVETDSSPSPDVNPSQPLSERFQKDLRSDQQLRELWEGIRLTFRPGTREVDRSRMDSQLVYRLVHLGYSDGEIGPVLLRFPHGKATERSDVSQYVACVVTDARNKIGPPPPADVSSVIDKLSKMHPVEYDRVRQERAEALGIRVATLDSEVMKLRLISEERNGRGSELRFEDPDSWKEPVGGSALLDEIEAVFTRFLFLPEGAATTLTLWVALTYVFDFFDVCPYLLITSPEKRCGKTRIMEILLGLVGRALPVSNISPASLFRTIEKEHPTLLVDEADSFMTNNEELRGIVNSGHRKGLAFVIRTVGDDHEPRQFSTWCPKAIALIGSVQATIEDRSIVIRMRRKKTSERVERFRTKDVVQEFLDLRRKLVRWINDNRHQFAGVKLDLPDNVGDRERDKWEPLVAIAEVVGGDWPLQVRSAIEALTSKESSGESNAVQLLADLRDLFLQYKADRLSSEFIASELGKMEERPWPEWSKGRPITTRQLASLLRRFNVAPRSIRIGDETAKGYVLGSLEDAFSRYLPPLDPSQGSQSNNGNGLRATGDPSQEVNVTDRKSPTSPLQMRFVTDVTDQNREMREPGDDTEFIAAEVLEVFPGAKRVEAVK